MRARACRCAGRGARDTIRKAGVRSSLMRKAYIVAAVIAGVVFAIPLGAGTSGPTDLAGKVVQLFDARDSKPTVLLFVRTDCPISNRYAPELIRLNKEFSSSAVFYLVYADPANTASLIH